MNHGRELPAISTELQRQLAAKRDIKAPTSELSVVLEEVAAETAKKVPAMKVNGFGSFTFTGRAHQQIAETLGIPMKYYERMLEEAPELLAENANHWLHAQDKVQLVRLLDDKVRAILSNRYRMIDNWPVANAVLPEIFKAGAQVISSEITEDRLYFKAVLPNQFDVYARPGSGRHNTNLKNAEGQDVVRVGIVVRNSEVGQGAFAVEGFLERLYCDNGAIVTIGQKKYHVGRATGEIDVATEVFSEETLKLDDKALMAKMADVTRAAFDKERIEQVHNSLHETTKRKIEAPVRKVIEDVTKKFSMSEEQGNTMLDNLIADQLAGKTQWGLANAITAMANKESDYEKATELERIGGKVLLMDDADWQKLAA